MNNDQPRTASGKYSHKIFREISGESVALSAYDRPDATFHHPSATSTADYCIDFWASTHIPESVFTQFHQAHEEFHQGACNAEDTVEEIVARCTPIFEQWANDNPELAQNDEEAERYWADLTGSTAAELIGPNLNPVDTPVVVRAALMFHYAPQAQFAEEREKVLTQTVQLSEGLLTVAEVAEAFFTEELFWAASTEPSNGIDKDQAMLHVLQELSENVASNKDLQHQLIDAVNNSAEQQLPTVRLAQRQLSDLSQAHRDNLERNYQISKKEGDARRAAMMNRPQ